MLFQFLDTLRQKPKSVRNQYAFGFALSCTLIISGVWTLSLPSRFANIGSVAAVGSASSTIASAPFAGLFNQMKEQFAGAKEVIKSLPTATSTAEGVSTSTAPVSAFTPILTDENKAALLASTTVTTELYQATATSPAQQTILIATTSATTTQ